MVSRRYRCPLLENEFFSRKIWWSVEHRRTIEREKSEIACHRPTDPRSSFTPSFFTATYLFFSPMSHSFLPSSPAILWLQHPQNNGIKNPADIPFLSWSLLLNIPSHNQFALSPSPIPPLPNQFTSVSECVNTCKNLKRKKILERISRRKGGKNEESVEQNAIVRID